jgi:hypothetical protein
VPIEKELWVSNYGAVGDGVTNDTAAIQACFNAATTGSVIRFPRGTFLVSATLIYPGNIAIVGAGDSDSGTVIKVSASANLSTPVLACSDWYNNSTTCGNPVEIRDIQINGNGGTTGTGAHGLVAMNYYSIFERISINNVTGDGYLFSALNRGGTHITNTCVEVKIHKLQVRSAGQCGIHIYDTGTPLNSCTDGFLEDCIIQSAGTIGISVEMAPGWLVSGNHVYGTGQNGIYLQRCYATRCIGNYIDGYGSGTSTYIAGIALDCLDGRGSVCVGNTIGFENGAATGPYQALTVTGKGSATTVCTVSNNLINGGSQSGSIGYVYQAQGSQIGHPFVVYSINNDVRNVATTSFIDTNTTCGDLTVLNHIVSTGAGNSPTAAAGANNGTSPPAPVISGSDVSGKITFGSGTSPAAGSQVVATFAASYTNARVVITAINSASASLNLYVSAITSTTFTVSSVNAPSASQGNTVYGFYYHVLA